MGITLRKAQPEDCKKIHEMQVVSFRALLDKYKDYNTNPAAESIEIIESKMAQEFTDYYLVCLNDEIIGAIRIVRLGDDAYRISPMFILPEYQNKGYAQEAILLVESLYPQSKHWELDTIKQETKLCHLYEKMGYIPTGKEEPIQDNMTIVFYAK